MTWSADFRSASASLSQMYGHHRLLLPALSNIKNGILQAAAGARALRAAVMLRGTPGEVHHYKHGSSFNMGPQSLTPGISGGH